MTRDPSPWRILVTDAQELAGLGAIRSLGRAGLRVTAGYPHEQPLPAAARSRWCSAVLPYPNPWRQNLDFRAWLRDQIQTGNFDAVLPLSESAILAIDAMRADFPPSVRAILPAREHLKFSLSKFHACRAAQRAGLTIPFTVFIADGEGSWNPDLTGLPFPAIFKIDNRLAADGAYLKGHNFIAENPAEAHALLREYEGTRPGMIAQELVAGRGVGAFLLRWGGITQLSFAHRRLHEVPWRGGYSSLRASLRDPDLIAASERLLAEIGYEGVAMIEFRREIPPAGAPPRDYFMEINGRLWGSIALALHCGVDFPRALIALAKGDEFKSLRPVGKYPAGRRCRNTLPGEISYLISVLKSRPEPGAPQPPSKFGALVEFVLLTINPLVRRDYFWWTDPRPWFAQARFVFGDLTGRARKKLKDRRRTRAHVAHLDELRRRHAAAVARPGLLERPPKNILFLCFGNICRSPFAEFQWNALLAQSGREEPRAISAGFFDQIGRRTPERFESIIKSMALDMSTHRSKMATRDMIDNADMILLMDMENYADLVRIFPDAAKKTWLLGLFAGDGEPEIIDPYILPPAEAHTSYLRLQRAVQQLFNLITG